MGHELPTDQDGFATVHPVPDGIYGTDLPHWVDLRVHYSDNDDMPPPQDIAAWVERELANAMRDGTGPFPGNLAERDRISETVAVGVLGASPGEPLDHPPGEDHDHHHDAEPMEHGA